MMINYYDIDLIPVILKIFKVKNIIASELSDETVLSEIRQYSKDNDSSFISITYDNEMPADYNDYTLNVLNDLKDFEAIFLNDDPNWYTTYNELKIIKQNNGEFPLVFICNNVFPHKYRDSYSDPNIVPEEFRNEFSRELSLSNDMTIRDDYFHAVEENTPRNGVNSAVNDFLAENSSIGIMDLKFRNGIIILYPKNSISQIRLGLLSEKINEYSLNTDDFSDSLIENQILSDYISKFNISEDFNVFEEVKLELNEKEKIINDFEHKIKIHDDELSFKDAQITDVNSELSLKEAEIKSYESKLVNKETEINSLKDKLKDVNKELDSLKSDFIQKSEDSSQTNASSSQPGSATRLNEDSRLIDLRRHYSNQLAKLDNKEYCISCYKEKIENDHVEIEYLKNISMTKKILSPLEYIYLLIKSNPKELSLNYKLFKALKNSKCFDIGFYLNNNEDLMRSNWCKYFSPELHYVCNGFAENRKFNKKYFNRNSKKELLNYILNCDK